ncbi:unnamed protein product [Chilo suppressalis]|uniref:Uncharacterized protein n=1 Tax=Chilo suppressalis TaxID=168631 RepID=A0ABN8L2W4_CHISP|nr:unnamed protein product [Chilo suppressalis]
MRPSRTLSLPNLAKAPYSSGHCLLFSKGVWQELDGQLLVSWASRVYCDYVIAVGVLMFLVCLVQIYRMSVFLYRGQDSSFLSAFVEAVCCVGWCALVVVAAVLVTLGFMTWCTNIVERFPSCEDAAGQDIDKKDEISTNGFYMEIGTAQFGAWAAEHPGVHVQGAAEARQRGLPTPGALGLLIFQSCDYVNRVCGQRNVVL